MRVWMIFVLLITTIGCSGSSYKKTLAQREVQMEKSFKEVIEGYHAFREKFASSDDSVMQRLAYYGQSPEIMVISCCDSRVDPALILQSKPGDLFTVRNIANIVPPYKKDSGYNSTSAALEFGIEHLNVKHLIILGHSQCGGIATLVNNKNLKSTDFIGNWVSIINKKAIVSDDIDECAKQALTHSYKNCLTFPWINKRVKAKKLDIHLWFFDIKTGRILTYAFDKKLFEKPEVDDIG